MRRRRGFTLVELLVVVGIVAVLVGILLPALSKAIAASRLAKCAANLHQISVAFMCYVADNRGVYPPNLSQPSPGMYWYDDERIGRYAPSTRPPAAIGKPGGSTYVCPSDPSPARFCYSMNCWASSAFDVTVPPLPKSSGIFWTPHTQKSSSLILVAESYSSSGSDLLGWYAPPTIGMAGVTAGQRFGGGTGVSVNARRWKYVASELNFMRHREDGVGTYTQPKGRLNVLFADSHVSALTDRDLVDSSGDATGRAFWSPADWGRQLMDSSREAFAAIQSRYDELMAYCLRITPAELRSFVEPGDLVQDTFCEAVRSLSGFTETDDTSWSRWLMTIARRRMLYQLRRHRASRLLRQSEGDKSDSAELLLGEAATYDRTPSASAMSRESRRMVDDVLQRLRPSHAMALRWRYFEGLTHAQVATRTGRNEDAVRKLCRYALNAFRVEIVRLLPV